VNTYPDRPPLLIQNQRTSGRIGSTLGSVDLGDGFTKREGAFLTEAALRGVDPVLRIRAGVRLGSLQLRTT
jgi:hypothetical protein